MGAGSGLNIFGKIPAQGDFLRVGPRSPIVGALDQWLQGALRQLQQQGSQLDRAPLRFALCEDPSLGVAVGSMIPSLDSAGRRFPLLAFWTFATRDVGPLWPAHLRTMAPLHAACERILDCAAGLNARALAARAAAFVGPDVDALAIGHRALLRGLEFGSARDLLERAYGSLESGAHYYGLSTALVACDSVRRGRSRGRDQGRGRIVLALPEGGECDAEFWLQLIARGLGEGSPPSLIWRASRVLVALGRAPVSLLTAVEDPQDRVDGVWPLVTAKRAAIERAKSGFSARQLAIIDDPNATQSALIDALTGP